METEKKTEIGREGEREARTYWRSGNIISCIPTGGGIIMNWILWPRRRASWWWLR